MKKILRLFSVLLIVTMFMQNFCFTVDAKSIKLSKKVVMNKGEKFSLKLKGYKGKVKWSSSKKSVATISSSGKITAKKKGLSVVTAKVKNKKYKCKVKVEDPKISKKSLTTFLNTSYKLTVKGTTQKIKWTSSNTKVATVKNGIVTSKKTGKANITAKIGKSKYICKITVIASVFKDKTIQNNYDKLKNFIIENGFINNDDNYCFKYSHSKGEGVDQCVETFGAIYDQINDTFEFLITAEPVSYAGYYRSVSVTIDPNSTKNTAYARHYVSNDKYSSSGLAYTNLDLLKYNTSDYVYFNLDSVSGFTNGFMQESANLNLELGMYCWSDIFSYYLGLDMSDFGFILFS